MLSKDVNYCQTHYPVPVAVEITHQLSESIRHFANHKLLNISPEFDSISTISLPCFDWSQFVQYVFFSSQYQLTCIASRLPKPKPRRVHLRSHRQIDADKLGWHDRHVVKFLQQSPRYTAVVGILQQDGIGPTGRRWTVAMGSVARRAAILECELDVLHHGAVKVTGHEHSQARLQDDSKYWYG